MGGGSAVATTGLTDVAAGVLGGRVVIVAAARAAVAVVGVPAIPATAPVAGRGADPPGGVDRGVAEPVAVGGTTVIMPRTTASIVRSGVG